MSKKILRPIAAIAAIAVNFIPGLGQVAALGIKIGVGALISTGIAVASSVLLRPKAPRISSAASDRLNSSISPNAPRKIVYGHTAMATDVRYQAFTGTDQEYYHQIMCVASHEVEAIEEIWFDTELAWTSAGGAQGRYAGYLTVTPRLVGTASNGIAIDGVWTSACTLTGCAYVHLKFKLTGNDKKAESPFAQQVPSRVTVRGKGAKVYDARFDSTAGGSGLQRVNDQSTWAYAPSGVESGRNQAFQLLHYLMGWKINGKLAIGRGMPSARFDIPSFITAANMNDEAVAKAAGGTEPRYRADGVFSEADDPSTVIDNLLASMNAVLRDDGGKISLTVLHNDLGAPVAHFDENDILGDELWKQTPSIDETFNIVRGSYTDPSNTALYQMVDAPEVAVTSIDGIDRIETFDLAVCQSPSQWQRLAKQRAQRALYPGVYSANFGARAWQVSLGKVVTLSHIGLGWDNKLFRVIAHGVAVNGVVPMALIEEHPAIYAWDKEETPAVQAAVPTVYDPTKAALIQAIAEHDLALGSLASDIATLDAAVDGKVTTFYQAAAPTAEGAGDLWIDTDDGNKLYRWSGSGWVPAQDAGIGAAITAAAGAQATADGKVTTFYQDATPTAEGAGDLWVRPSDNPKVIKRWSGSAWVAQTPVGFQQIAIFDDMAYATVAEAQENWDISNPPNTQIVTTTDTGGKSLQIGNVTGTNDFVSVLGRKTLSYSPEDLYEVTFDLEITVADASALFFLGVRALDNNGVNIPGNGTYCYVAANGLGEAANLGRKTYRGYMRGYGSVNPTNSIDNPSPLPAGTAKIGAAGLIHYFSAAGRDGTAVLHGFTLRKISDATVIWSGDWSSSRTYYLNEGVIYQGRAFASRANGNTNNAPPTTATSNSFWYLVADKGATGAAGADGLNNATVFLFKRSATTPALPSVDTTYTYATKALSGANNGWTQAVPARDGNPLYVTAATASSASTTDTIAASEWAAPVIQAQDGATGAQGADGLNSATVYLYQRATSAPAAPAATLTYTFATGVLSGTLGSWSQAVPAANGNPLYVTTATALGSGATDTIAASEWAAVKVMAKDGNDGTIAWTPVLSSGMTRNGSTFTKTGGVGGAWDQGFYSAEKAAQLAVSFKASQTNKDIMAGLNSDPATNDNFTSIDYALQCASDGKLYPWANGSSQGATIGTYTTSDVLGVAHRDNKIVCLKNGAVIYTFTVLPVTSTTLLAVDSSFFTAGAEINSVSVTIAGQAGISPIAVSVDPPSLTIACSYDGTPKSGELPASFAFTAIQGGAGVAISSIVIASSGGCTVSVSGSAVNLTAISAGSGGFIADVTAGGQTVPVAVNFTTTNDAPPASTSVTDTSSTNVTSTTYAVIGGELTIKASATGKLRAKLAGSYKTNVSTDGASTTLTGKLQVKPAAGAYADVTGSETTGSASTTTSLGDGGPPYKTFSGGLDTGWITLTGLIANGDYVLRRQAKLTAGSGATSSCSLTISAEPVA